MTPKQQKIKAPLATPNVTIQKLGLTQLDNINVYNLNARSLQLLKDSHLSYSENPDLYQAVTEWQATIELFYKAVNQERRQEMTKPIQEANQLRNGDFSALKRSLAAFESSKRPDEIEAYKALTPILTPFKDCGRLDYEKESLQLNKLLEKLTDETITTHLGTLGLTRLVTNLQDSQAQFEKIFTSGNDKKANTARYDTSQIRKALITHYQRVLNLLEILVTLRQDSLYAQLITLLNIPRQYYSDYLAHHSGKKIADKAVTSDDDKTSDKVMALTEKTDKLSI